MLPKLTCYACGLALLANLAFAEVIPPLELASDHIRIVVMPLEREHGKYGHARFDWSGIVGYVESRGHTFIGSKNAQGERSYSLGTSGEFIDTLPLTLDEKGGAATGIRIGVGYVEGQELTQALPWEVTTGDDFIAYRQTLRDASGYGYDYAKRVALVDDEPAFTMSHTLTNTGSKPITTRTYTHNWLRIDNTPGNGENYRLVFNYDIKPTKRNYPQLHMNLIGRAIVHDPAIEYAKGLYYARFTPFERVEENVVTVENLKTKAAMRISGDWAPGWYDAYITTEAVCPEPMLQLDLKPGESRTWMVRYECITP